MDSIVSERFVKDQYTRTCIASIIGGLSAGCLGVFTGHPFDTLKVRLQVGQRLLPQNLSFFGTCKDLYRGVGPPATLAGVMSSVNFFVYENARKYFTRAEYTNSIKLKVDLHAVIYGSIISGMLSSIAASPVGLVKVQQQVVADKSMWATAKHLYKTHGTIRVFYGAAYLPVLICDTYGRSVYFWTYEKCKYELNNWNGDEPLNNLTVRMISAPIAGVTSWTCIYPLDVIKAKLQVDLDGSKYNHSVISCFKNTIKEGGYVALFRGLGFTLIRAAPVAGVILPMYEFVKENVEKLL